MSLAIGFTAGKIVPKYNFGTSHSSNKGFLQYFSVIFFLMTIVTQAEVLGKKTTDLRWHHMIAGASRKNILTGA